MSKMEKTNRALQALQAHGEGILSKQFFMFYTGEDSQEFADRLLEKKEKERRFVLDLIQGFLEGFPDLHRRDIGFQFVSLGTPNAVTIHDPVDDSYAIGLDFYVYEIATEMLLAAHVAYGLGKPDTFAAYASDSVPTYFFSDTADEKFIKQRRAFYSLLAGLGTDAVETINALMNGIGYAVATFILGHELGHICLDHFGKGRGQRSQLTTEGNRKDEVSAFSYANEFEADAWSFKALIHLAQNLVDRILAQTVPAAFFSLMALFEDFYRPQVPLGRLLYQTHPPAWERAVKLKEMGSLKKVPLLPPLAEPLPPIWEVFFHIPDMINSIRSDWFFQDYARMVRQYYSVE